MRLVMYAFTLWLAICVSDVATQLVQSVIDVGQWTIWGFQIGIGMLVYSLIMSNLEIIHGE